LSIESAFSRRRRSRSNTFFFQPSNASCAAPLSILAVRMSSENLHAHF
jgi:hypothetical protein